MKRGLKVQFYGDIGADIVLSLKQCDTWQTREGLGGFRYDWEHPVRPGVPSFASSPDICVCCFEGSSAKRLLRRARNDANIRRARHAGYPVLVLLRGCAAKPPGYIRSYRLPGLFYPDMHGVTGKTTVGGVVMKWLSHDGKEGGMG